MKVLQALREVRWGKIAAIFILPVVVWSLVVFAAQTGWTIRENYGQAAMQKRLDALQAAGFPIDNLTLEKAYLERTSPAHTERWLAVMEQFESDEFRKAQTGVYHFDPQLDELPFAASGEWSCEAATRNFVESHEEMVKELRELSQYREAVRFPIVFDSMNTLLPWTQHMRTASRVLSTDGLIAIRDHDSSRIRADIEAIFDCAFVCSKEPFLVSQLVCMALEFSALDVLKQAVEHDCLALEDLKGLLPRLLERSALSDQWRVTLQGERSLAIPCFLEPHRAGMKGSFIPARGWDCVIYLDLMDKALAIDTSSLDALLAGGERLEAELRESQRNGGWLHMADSIMTGLMAPAFQALAEVMVRNRTENRLAAHAVATAIFHKSHGRWPKDLSELNLGQNELSQADLAPSGGRPFGYRIEADGGATLWGFSLRQTRSTPPEPPALEGTPAQLEETRRILWHLPAP